MGIVEAFRAVWNALLANKLRSSLTLLGMVIGVFAVIASVTAVKVIDVYFHESLQFLGPSTFSVQKEPAVQFGGRRERERPDITYRQVRQLTERISYPVSPQEAFDLGIASRGQYETNPNVFLIGTNQHLLGNYGYEIKTGRGLTEADVQYARPVALISPDVAEVLFPNAMPLGKEITYDGQHYQVVGVLESKGSFLGVSFDHRVFVPITTAFETYGQPGRNISVSVRASSVRELPDAIDTVIGHMRVIRGVAPGEENNFEISTNDTMQRTFEAFTATLTAGGAGIGAIALLAAGIGIMNIMLVSVTERTREIGIRKAVGARRRDILKQFLLEAFFLCQIGGLVGIALGAAFGNIVAVYFDISAAFPWGWAIGGLVGVTLIALVFGSYPAWKAARLDPIESLRYE